MKEPLRLILLLLLSLGFHRAAAQCKDNVFEYLDANQAKMRYQNGGNMFWDMFGLVDCEIPKGSGLAPTFAGAIWVGGLDPQGELHVAASNYRQTGWDWYVGPARSGPNYVCNATIETPSDIFLNGIKRLSNGKVLVLTTDDLLIYDLQTLQTITVPLPAPRVWLGVIELPDGRIFLVGDDLYPTKNPTLFLDTLTYTLSGGPTLNWFHQESSLDVLDDGKVLIAGVVGCEVFDPQTNISTVVPDMLYPRMKHGTVKLPNGDIFAIGGGSSLNGSGVTLVSQYFDDTLGYWFPGPSMSIGRQRATATRMPDGKIFICGGAISALATDIYDPNTNTVTPGPPLPVPGSELSAAMLDSHTVLLGTADQQFQNILFKFDILTGEVKGIHIQRAGPRMLLIDPTSALVEVNDYRQLQHIDFESGFQFGHDWQHVWKLNRAEIDQFKADFLTGNVDFSNYPEIESWPAHGDEALGEDRNLAPFVDVNQDGYYRPGVDGDYPCIVGDQALWWVYNDQGPHAESGGRALGIQIEAMAYAVDCQQTACPDTSLDYATFLHLEVTNRSDTAYHDMYISNFNDFDMGSGFDDFLASDSTLHLAIAYNGDNDDASYGVNPPAWGATVLPNGRLGAMGNMMSWENTIGSYNSQPQVPQEFYNYMGSTFRDGQHLVNNGLNGYPGLGAGPQSNFIFPSTDGFCNGQLNGWNEFSAGNQPFDRFFLQSAGPFDLQPGESTQLDIGFVYARDSNNLASVCKLKSSTAAIRNWWQLQLDRACFNTLVARDEPLAEAAFKVFPNPSVTRNLGLNFGSALEDDGNLEVLDVQGRLLMRVGVQAGVLGTRLDVHHLPAGMYLLRLRADERVETQRVILY